LSEFRNNVSPSKEVNLGEALIGWSCCHFCEIALKTGVSTQLLMSVNHLENPNRIYPGQRLLLPVQNRLHTSRD
jgi:hypothetical protein